MITGKVTDKATKAPMPGVHVILADTEGDYVKDNDGGVVFVKTDKNGVYEMQMGPGQYVHFNTIGYPVVMRSYEEAIRKPNVEMDDATGTALSLDEVRAFVKDAGKQVNGRWLIGVGITVLLGMILIIVGKKNGWF